MGSSGPHCQEAEPHWLFAPRDGLRTWLSGSSLLAYSSWWLWCIPAE